MTGVLPGTVSLKGRQWLSMTGHIIPAGNPSGVFFSGKASTFANGANFISKNPIALSNYSKGVCSFWLNPSAPGGEAELVTLYHTSTALSSPGVFLWLHSDGVTIEGRLGAALNTTSYTYQTSASLAPYEDGKWHHYLVSWDYSAPSFQIAIDGVKVPLPFTATNIVLSTAAADQASVDPAASGVATSIAEYWLLTNISMDVAVLSNIRKFMTATRRPAFLGMDGSLPTGAQPEIYLKGSGNGFNVNSGTLGNFTTTGTLTTPTTTPSSP